MKDINDPDKDLQVMMTPEVEAQMAVDPELAKAVQEFIAVLHQARAGVLSGQYKSMDDGVEALTGNRPEKFDAVTGERIEGASMHHDMGLDAPSDGRLYADHSARLADDDEGDDE